MLNEMFKKGGGDDAPKEIFSFSELDIKFQEDKDGSYKKEVIAKMEKHLTEIRGKMNSGTLKPEEFEMAKKIESGIKAAVEIVNKTAKMV